MTPPEFDWSAVGPGEKVSASLPVGSVTLPVLAVRGTRPGKTLLVSAGVHGDEHEGIRTIFDTFSALDPAQMTGNFLAVPVANPPAFWNGTRTSPLDDGNLARVFPGDPDGSPTQAIAWAFDQRLLPLADFYLDLHSGGVKFLMPTMVGYHEQDAPARLAADAFGAPVIWCHPAIAPGRTVSAAGARGIPCLYAEARGAGRIHPDDLAVYRRGVARLLQHLAILPGVPEPIPPQLRLHGDGNIDGGVTATQPGFLLPEVELLQWVERGQRFGRLLDIWGRQIDEFFAPRSGVVVLIHACPMVQPGEPLFLVTDVQP